MVGGQLLTLTINNPDAGLFTFYGMKGEESTYILGGLENDDNEAVDASGELVLTKDLKQGSCEGTFSNNMGATMPALEFSQLVQNSLNLSIITFTNVNQVTYSGKGTIVGKVSLNAYKNTISFKVVSGLGFTQQ